MAAVQAVIHNNHYGMDLVIKLRNLILVAVVLFTSNAFALTKGQQVDRYIMSAQKYYKQGSYDKAFNEFQRVENVGIQLDNNFHYFYSMAAFKSGHDLKAWDEIRLYLSKTERSGQYYQKALEVYDTIQHRVSRDSSQALSDLDDRFKKWKKLESKYQLENGVSVWVVSQKKAASRLAQDQNYDAVLTLANNTSTRVKKYIDRVKKDAATLETIKADINKLEAEIRFGLISRNNITGYKKNLSQLWKHFKALEFDSFLSKSSMLRNEINKQNHIVKGKKRDILNTANKDALRMKSKMVCYSARSELKAHEKINSYERDKRYDLKKLIEENCGLGGENEV